LVHLPIKPNDRIQLADVARGPVNNGGGYYDLRAHEPIDNSDDEFPPDCADNEPPKLRVPNNRGWVYQNHWMSMHRIPPVPLWTVGWFFNFMDWWSGRRR
jgi:hypothetical protein